MDDSPHTTPSVNDVWANLRDGENERLSEYRIRAAALKGKSKISVVDLIKRTEKKENEREKAGSAKGTSEHPITISKEKKKKKKTIAPSPSSDILNDILQLAVVDNDEIQEHEKERHVTFRSIDVPTESKKVIVRKVATVTSFEPVNQATDETNDGGTKSNAVLIKANEMMSKIARDLNLANADDMNDRRRALQKIQKILFTDYTMSTGDYNEVFRESCKSIFKRYSDVSEKCRELSLKVTQSFFELSSDLVPILAYFFPMLMQRLPNGLAYDEDMKVFITNIEMHEAYRRGKAVDRQDKIGGSTGELIHHVVEESEEIRYLLCKLLGCLLKRTIFSKSSSILHPYFHEIVMYLQMQIRDPFPELKAEACNIVEILARTDEFNSGMKFFAVALVRVSLPILRHRHSKVSTSLSSIFLFLLSFLLLFLMSAYSIFTF